MLEEMLEDRLNGIGEKVDINDPAIMELFAEQWKGMPAFQKSVYRQLAEGERQRYVKELRL